MEQKKPPIVRSGERIRHGQRGSGTLGPMALTNDGHFIYIITQHQLDKNGGLLYLEPEMISIDGKTKEGNFVGVDYSLKFKDVFEDYPIVLKQPIFPEKGRWLYKVGMATGFTHGKVTEIDKTVNKVDMKDGTVVRMEHMIETEKMGEDGDSGSISLTISTHEPVGLLSCGSKDKTYFVKLKDIVEKFNLQGIFAPLSLPPDTSDILRRVISSFLPDGIFLQTNNLQNKTAKQLMNELGIIEIGQNNIIYSDLMILDIKLSLGDGGSWIMDKENRMVGLVVGGSDKSTLAIPIQRVLQALSLDLISPINKNAWITLLRAGYWRTRCPYCYLIIPPSAKSCSFCKRPITISN